MKHRGLRELLVLVLVVVRVSFNRCNESMDSFCQMNLVGYENLTRTVCFYELSGYCRTSWIFLSNHFGP